MGVRVSGRSVEERVGAVSGNGVECELVVVYREWLKVK
jgi:hypothetical protein